MRMRPKDALHPRSLPLRRAGGSLHARRGRVPQVRLVWFVGLFLGSLWSAPSALAEGEDCGDIKNAYGPYDYRTIPAFNLSLVEGGHYTPNVEHLITGQSGRLGADLDYTLRAIPNHPRALVSMVNLTFRDKKDPPQGARYVVTCWFDRAMRMAPDDPKVRSVYGYYLSRKGDHKAAVEQFRYALELGADDGNTHYNLGLALFNVKEYDEALREAKTAEERGFPLQGLKNKLKAVNKWTE